MVRPLVVDRKLKPSRGKRKMSFEKIREVKVKKEIKKT